MLVWLLALDGPIVVDTLPIVIYMYLILSRILLDIWGS